MNNRIEKDSIGTIEVPENALYGVQSVRGKNNFNLTGQLVHVEFIKGLAITKKASAIANSKANIIDKKIADAMVKACDEIIEGKHNDQFVVENIQGGAGTSFNMNMNEVISNRAQQILGGKLGVYDIVNPNDHANCGQSTNDAFPTGGKIATLTLGYQLIDEMKLLHESLVKKEKEFSKVIKMGRTHLQDAIPITLGQEFGAFAQGIKRDITRVQYSLESMLTHNMGATAVGTGLNADTNYIAEVEKQLALLTGWKMKLAEDLVDGTRNLDNFVWLSSALKTLAVNLSKTANDLRLMASGPTAGLYEIKLPEMQPGSSIMPGKVNPVIAEAMNQVSFQVFGNDLVVTKAAEAGQLELNVFEPVLFKNLFESLEILKNGIKMFRTKLIDGVTPNIENCQNYVKRSIGIVTALVPHLGYVVCAQIAKDSLKLGKSVEELVIQGGHMSQSDYDKVMDAHAMTTPGIAGEEIYKKR